MSDPTLSDLVAGHRAEIAALVERSAGRILRYETADDVVQGIQARAIERSAGFAYRGPAQFVAWIEAVARSYLADRHNYWSALRRRPARLVRLGTAPGTDGDEPRATATGPSTFASRREQIAIALRALALLLPRDRDLVRFACEDMPNAEQAARLGISEEAAAKARQRAIERFRKAFELTTRG